ncbi:MAG: NfeD family protein [Spirochaetes bacterium]|nr:NfeD family protein [Spirochaetota bacterium]
MNFTVSGINIWWMIGIILVLLEFLIPGLVIVFLGLGAFVVAAFLHFGLISGIIQELLTWFISSIFFLVTLRFLVMMYYPSDTKKKDINEDHEVIGTIVDLLEDITENQKGRIKHSDSTWPAASENGEEIKAGEKVEIVGRENLTWIVKKIN